MILKTGIPKLDEALQGGISKNKSMMLYSTPGVESIPFAFQLLHTRLEEGDKVIYLVNNKKPDSVRFMIKDYGWDVSEYEKKGMFVFFDAYSGLIGLESEERYKTKEVNNLEKIRTDLFAALEEMKDDKNTIMVFDSLSTLIDMCGNTDMIGECVNKCFPDLEKLNVTPIFLFTAWAYDSSMLDKIRGFFDCVVDLKAIEEKVILRNYFTVHKADWADGIKKQGVPFKVTRPGGIKVYIPKLLVTGPFNAGKSSFIHSASTKAVSVDRLGTTIALDHGHVDYEGFSVDLWGTPGQERFDPIIKNLGGESMGVIIVVDSTDPAGFARAKELVGVTKTEGLPLVIAANKSDMDGALKVDEVKERMGLPDDLPVIAVTAEDITQVKKDNICKLKDDDIHSVLHEIFKRVV